MQVRERRIELGERPVAWDRCAHRDDRERQPPLAFVELEVVEQPDLRGIAQLRRGARQLKIMNRVFGGLFVVAGALLATIRRAN